MSFFGDMMTMFAGGDKPEVQTPQVATTAEEFPHETGRTAPQSDAENLAIAESEEAERDKRRAKQGQQSTILTGSLSTPAEDEPQRKTLLGA
jgi:hypothetical protein